MLQHGPVTFIDGPTRTVTGCVDVGQQPNGIAVDPVTRTVYVTDVWQHQVWRIDTDTHAVEGTIPVGQNASAVAVDQSLRKVFVTNEGADTIR
ncbi:MAG: YncE family protein [Acidimicrobiales bacterium]